MYVLKCTCVNQYKYQLVRCTNIEKTVYKSLQGKCSSVLRPILRTE